MEEDGPTPRALPRWVELEYKVNTSPNRLSELGDTHGFDSLIYAVYATPPPPPIDEPNLEPATSGGARNFNSIHHRILFEHNPKKRAYTKHRKHMRTLAGPDASVAFTHLSPSTSASLSTTFASSSSPSTSSPDPASPAPTTQQQAQAECHEQGVLELMQACDIPRERVCLLDPKASEALTPADGDSGKFAWFLFGVRFSSSSHSLLYFPPPPPSFLGPHSTRSSPLPSSSVRPLFPF